jgi:hypothetical protein
LAVRAHPAWPVTRPRTRLSVIARVLAARSLPAWTARAAGAAPPRPPGFSTPARYGTLNPLSIAYGLRPRLRARLTRGGLTSPRNPWACGVPGSNGQDATHAGILARRPSTAPHGTASLVRRCSPTAPACAGAHGVGGGLEPRWIVGAAAHSTSELLRTLSRMAASKPTSWLSARRDLLAH